MLAVVFTGPWSPFQSVLTLKEKLPWKIKLSNNDMMSEISFTVKQNLCSYFYASSQFFRVSFPGYMTRLQLIGQVFTAWRTYPGTHNRTTYYEKLKRNSQNTLIIILNLDIIPSFCLSSMFLGKLNIFPYR